MFKFLIICFLLIGIISSFINTQSSDEISTDSFSFSSDEFDSSDIDNFSSGSLPQESSEDSIHEIYVDVKKGKNTYSGNMTNPIKDFMIAYELAKQVKALKGNDTLISIYMTNGVYNLKSTVEMVDGISIYGGYNSNWERGVIKMPLMVSGTLFQSEMPLIFDISGFKLKTVYSHLTMRYVKSIAGKYFRGQTSPTIYGLKISYSSNLVLRFLSFQSNDADKGDAQEDPWVQSENATRNQIYYSNEGIQYMVDPKSAGMPGGSSIGLYIWNSPNIVVEFCNLISKDGGDGGEGLIGGDGGYSVPVMVFGRDPSMYCNNLQRGHHGRGGYSSEGMDGDDGLSLYCYSASNHKEIQCDTKIHLYTCIKYLQDMDCEFSESKDTCGICNGNKQYCNIGCDDKPNGKVMDVCGVCGGHNDTCIVGCDGVVNSTKVVDACGVCGGHNDTCVVGCDGKGNSGKVIDACGVCGGHNDTCVVGCDGKGNSGKVIDACGVCGGHNDTCVVGCDGKGNSGKVVDACGKCGGKNDTCLIGCDGEVNSTLVVDACGKCGGKNDSCLIGCDGEVGSLKVWDLCKVCGGKNDSCTIGCDGKPFSYKTIDSCGVCGGDGSTCSNAAQKQGMQVATKIIISIVVITVSIYGILLSIFFVRRRLTTHGSQYYRTKLILEYQDAPLIQAELIKTKNNRPISNILSGLGISRSPQKSSNGNTYQHLDDSMVQMDEFSSNGGNSSNLHLHHHQDSGYYPVINEDPNEYGGFSTHQSQQQQQQNYSNNNNNNNEFTLDDNDNDLFHKNI
ncbi:hypothetical protein DLAC_11009 [Tieghemostelium lacteum]|uniref:Uncharacterized protein n=1 Tax=Tieghemostelium lacteum TaxID=361077 RepID=A0A151Z2X6_TIELA|nr:hypothetical protein DLAC_11009 [Tieghemostelium lacteum]|eukprot:KYQ88313.1 hypothetical protein DLAC_11009 [Tieghemostelium lacteum]